MDVNPFDAAKRSASGDCVVYSIHLPWIKQKDLKEKREIMTKLHAAKIQFEIALAPHLAGYLWNKSAFCLFVNDSHDSPKIRPHLAGYTNVGDNIEDEWFVVFLLFQLSKAFPDIIIRVVDQDGQFLLIESAQELPEWLEPDNSDNRVFLRGGEVHILPLHITPTRPNPPLCECLEVMSRARRQYVAKKSIQNIITRRMQLDIRENSLHIATCVVPVTVASVLKEAPESVALAVNAFYGRDDLDTKAAMRMARFKPDAVIDFPVRFTRTLFAKLSQQQFHPPRCFAPVLAEVNVTTKGKDGKRDAQKNFRSRSLGMKLSVAFEMLAARHQKLFEEAVAPPRPPSRTDALRSAEWRRVQEILAARGFFQGAGAEGSRTWLRRRDSALDLYLRAQTSGRRNISEDQVLRKFRHACDQPVSEQELEAFVRTRRLTVGKDSGEDWMYLRPDHLERHLDAYRDDTTTTTPSATTTTSSSSTTTNTPSTTTTTTQPDMDPRLMTELPSRLLESVKGFVSHQATIDGAEIPKESKATKRKATPQPKHGVDLDVGEFWRVMEETLQDIAAAPGNKRNSANTSRGDIDGADVSAASAGESQRVQPAVKGTGAVTSVGVGAVTGTGAVASGFLASGFLGPGASSDARFHGDEEPDSDDDIEGATDSDDDLEDGAWANAEAEDSDDDVDAARAVMHAMDQELDRSQMAKSFKREQTADTSDKSSADTSDKSTSDHQHGGAKGETTAAAAAADLAPVDLNLNLVENLLQSYSLQHGLPGPVSNLLGELGVDLPDAAKE